VLITYVKQEKTASGILLTAKHATRMKVMRQWFYLVIIVDQRLKE
jgi:hypothetical protein